MLEFFLIQKSLNNIENFHDPLDEEEKEKSLSYMFVKYCFLLFKIVTILVAVYLAYDCNINSSIITKVALPVFAFFFPIVYLTWYFIYRYMLDHPCNEN